MALLRLSVMVLMGGGFVAAADPVGVPFGKKAAAVPAGWKAEKPANRLRSHQFKLPSPDPAFADAEVYVMPESDPRTEKYFPRWKETVAPPEGKTADDIAKVSKLEAGGAVVHLLDMTGTWTYKERPFDPKSKTETRPDHRVVWAIVVTGDEASHVRLSGPMNVVATHYPAFEAWLKAIK